MEAFLIYSVMKTCNNMFIIMVVIKCQNFSKLTIHNAESSKNVFDIIIDRLP
jgi:hypothetical protein